MTRLCEHTLSFPKQRTDLLFGSFMDWYNASHTEKGITASMHDEALAMLHGHAPSRPTPYKHKYQTYFTCINQKEYKNLTSSVKYHAALRVVALWHVYLTYRNTLPLDSMFAYYCGILMDLHQPIIQHKSAHPLVIHEVYVHGIAPEQTPLARIYTMENMGVSNAPIEDVWAQYIRDCTSTKHIGNKKNTTRKKKKRAKKLAPLVLRTASNRTSYSIPLMVQPSLREEPLFSVPQIPRTFNQVALKGVLRTTSVRYIQSSLYNALILHPEKNNVIVMMIKLFFLGANKNATIIAPPYHRVRIYSSMPTSAYYHRLKKYDPKDQIKKYDPKELFAIIAEYIIMAATRNSGLIEILRKDPDWNSYTTHAQRMCDQYLRANMYGKDIGITVSRRAPRATIKHPKLVPSSSAIFWALAKGLGPVKHKVTSKIVHLAKQGITCSLYDMYRCFSDQSSNCQIIKGVLDTIGINKQDIDIIMTQGKRVHKEKLSKGIGIMLKSISKETKAVLHLYVHYLIKRSLFAVLPIQHPIDDLVLANKKYPSIIVCTNCFTIRSQCRGTTGECQKSKESIHIDIMNHTIMCSTCKSPDIKSVSLARNRVMGVTLMNLHTPQIITRCHMCDAPTVMKYIIGVDDFCYKCYNKAHKELEARVCVCGVPFNEKRTAKSRLMARSESGKLSMYALCRKHAYLTKHAGAPNLPIGMYKKIIALSEAHHIIH